MRILITGAAGFIGSALFARLAARGDEVTGIDNLNAYYDVRLKYARLRANGFAVADNADAVPPGYGETLCNRIFPSCRFIRMSIDDRERMETLFREGKFDKVVNLAAQAGVRYSITDPYSYLQSNLSGFLTVLECCRHAGVRHLVFASSSSVYGLGSEVPYKESGNTDRPASLYAATKKADELMAHAYCHLYGIRMTGLRYFTVYGPWGRPDMAPMLFTGAIMRGEPIKVFNMGDLMRDFTYIDDIVEGTVRVMDSSGEPDGQSDSFKVYNIGCSSPVKLMDFISEIESAVGRTAEKVFLPMQPGDVYETYADTSSLEHDTGYRPSVSLHEGIGRFIDWYMSDDNPLRQ